MAGELSRRMFLAGTGMMALAAGGCATMGMTGTAGRPGRRRVARVAHLTDIHVQPEERAGEWMAKCLHHAQQLADPPTAILNGGDLIMDALAAWDVRTQEQWEIAERVFRDECSLPVLHCIGNHDVWGWDEPWSKADPLDPRYGKAWALDVLGLDRPYYSTDLHGWHLITLDSTHRGQGGRVYEARLDEEQFDWLERELAAIPADKPILIHSHIPILSGASFFDGENEKSGDWVVPGSWMHLDARRINALFLKHPNVRVAISGHLHLVDRVDYDGVSYLCNGAVCGAWWDGKYHQCPPGYALIDLYDDGSFGRDYVTYGWEKEQAGG